MPDKPAAEVRIDEKLVRELVVSQAHASVPDAAALTLRHAADGWDCSVWRWGDDLAVRLPRRLLAAPLVVHEQRALPDIAARLAASGVRVPAPLFAGSPGAGYPWAWSIVPWMEGMPGLAVPRPDRRGWAAPLADALMALHVAAPTDHPVNVFRGGPLRDRADAVRARITTLRAARPDLDLDAAEAAWTAGLAARAWSGPPVWIHGDLHPGNLVADGSALVGIIDFGDVTAGDPAYDLAVAWLAFDAEGRSAFIARATSHYDDATWVRARAWSAAVALMLLNASDDDPAYAALGRDALDELSAR